MSRESIDVESYKHGNDTEQDRIRVGDNVVRRYGKAYSVWEVTRIFRTGKNGNFRFDLVNTTTGGAHDGDLAANWQKAGVQ